MSDHDGLTYLRKELRKERNQLDKRLKKFSLQ